MKSAWEKGQFPRLLPSLPALTKSCLFSSFNHLGCMDNAMAGSAGLRGQGSWCLLLLWGCSGVGPHSTVPPRTVLDWSSELALASQRHLLSTAPCLASDQEVFLNCGFYYFSSVFLKIPLIYMLDGLCLASFKNFIFFLIFKIF